MLRLGMVDGDLEYKRSDPLCLGGLWKIGQVKGSIEVSIFALGRRLPWHLAARLGRHLSRIAKRGRFGDMGRGVSCGGGQSSLGYLFGSNEAPKPVRKETSEAAPTPIERKAVTKEPKPSAAPPPVDISKQIPAGIQSTTTNNYFRADGQNTCNFITDRPSTKVHAAPGGGSSLGYLFGGGSN